MEPLEIEFSVACPPERAFELWATRTSQWWPRDHTVSAEPGLTVSFEPRPGGRIYERTPGGVEHDWGQVLVWDPPRRLSYRWHLAQDRRGATEVEVTFRGREGESGEGAAAGTGANETTVTIVHRGWERLGARGADLRQRNRQGWAGLIPHYQRAAAAGG